MSAPRDEPQPPSPGTDTAALARVLRAAVRRTRGTASGLYVTEPDQPVLRLVALCGVPVEFAEPWRRVRLTAPVPVADAVREERLVWVGGPDDLARNYPRAAVALPYRFALAAAPIPGPAGPLGALLLLFPGGRPQRASPEELEAFVGLAHDTGRTLEDVGPLPLPAEPYRIGLEPEGPAWEPAAAFADRLPGGSLALDLEGRITFVTDAALDLFGVPREHVLGTLPWQSLPWLDDPVYEDRYRASVISRAPVAFTALRPPDRWLSFALYPDGTGVSVRVLPAVEDPSAATALPETWPTAAGHSPRVGRLYFLMHLAAALTEATGVADVAGMVADQILPAFDADGTVLSVAEAGRLRILGHRGYDPKTISALDGLPVDTVLTPAGRVLDSGIPSYFGDRDELARVNPGAETTSDKEAWAFLPLIVAGRPTGCWVLSYEHPHEFTDDERAVLTSLAGLVAHALDRARMYDAKHHLAHALQEALLPRALPEISGLTVAARYLPAVHGVEVGGDFYDLIRLTDTTAAAVVGDVQGHNIAAAALMGQVRTAVHAHATAAADRPDEVLARTNRVIADLEPDLLVSCVYAHFDLARRRVCLASAGHPAPLLREADGRARTLPVEPGPLLGIERDTDYTVTAYELEAEDILVLYTDGLVEHPGVDIDRSTAELVAVLGAFRGADLGDLIDRLVRHAYPDSRYTDDIALLALRANAVHGSRGSG
ncbi:MAG: SpoIIE family protein phosphatase [Streptomycetaceae bacterium]|nr:SpoIIE family protein phosphatase [Streptomycetaceae bacterium]